MKRRKFITACSCCAFASAAAVLLNNNDLSPAQQTRIRLGINISEHCNLNCKYCYHFSCIAQKEFYDLDKFRQDMKRMSKVMGENLVDIQLMGGEPLLNPEINKYIEISRKYFPKTTINITTNATLLDDMDESFWKTVHKNNVLIAPSIYPLKINWKSILDKAEKYKVSIVGRSRIKNGYVDIITKDNLDIFLIDKFEKITLMKNGNKGYDNSKCEAKIHCNNMADGKFYMCPTVAYIRHLNKKFNTDFKVTEDDYIDLYKVKDIKEVIDFLNKPSIPFCRYCGKVVKNVKWENSDTHDLSEWT